VWAKREGKKEGMEIESRRAQARGGRGGEREIRKTERNLERGRGCRELLGPQDTLCPGEIGFLPTSMEACPTS
jgi:hypothetical protein